MPEWLGEKKGASSPAATKMNKQANQTSHQRKPYADGQVPRYVDLSVCAAFVVLVRMPYTVYLHHRLQLLGSRPSYLSKDIYR